MTDAHPNDTHLDTAHIERDIRGNTVRSGLVTLAAYAVRFGVVTVTIGTLGRLLTPRDFGLITMVMVVTNLLARFRTLGLEASTVQRKDINHAQVNALFWINIAFGVALTAVAAAASPLLAAVYNEPPVTGITIAISALFLIGALSAQHLAVLRRSMRFGRLAVIEIVAVIVAGAVSIAVAMNGGGYWALVVMHLTIAASICIGSWIASPWRPSRPASAPELRALMSFGAGVAGANLMQAVVRQADKIIIGIHLSADALGFYSRGHNLLLIPIQQVNYPLSNVALSALSRLQSDGDRYRLVYRKGILVVLSICLPPAVFALLFAEQCVLGVLGDQWGEAVPIFFAIVPAAIALAFEPAVRWVYVSTGNSGREFRWRLVAGVVTIAAFAIGLSWGVLGVAIAYSACAVAFRIPEIPYCFAKSPLTLKDLARASWRPALAPIIAGTLTAAPAHAFMPDELSQLAQLLILLPVFSGLTLLAWLALPGGTAELREARALLSEVSG